MAFTIISACTERWRLQELDSVIDSIEDSIDAAIQKHHVMTGNDYCNIVLRAAGKAVVCMRELICLVTYGYPDGALSISRNLYEQLIILAFFAGKQDDEEFDSYIHDYYLDYKVQRYNALIYECEKCTQDTERLKRLKSELEETRKNANSKENGMYWWSGYSSFSRLADSVIATLDNQNAKRLLYRLHLHYKRACMALHASCIGNTLRLGIDSDFAGIDTRPTEEGHGIVLWFATMSFSYIVGVVFALLEIEDNDYVNKLMELASYFDDEEWKESQ